MKDHNQHKQQTGKRESMSSGNDPKPASDGRAMSEKQGLELPGGDSAQAGMNHGNMAMDGQMGQQITRTQLAHRASG